jgi:hypothetical protein
MLAVECWSAALDKLVMQQLELFLQQRQLFSLQ